jgi:hypothetical protein
MILTEKRAKSDLQLNSGRHKRLPDGNGIGEDESRAHQIAGSLLLDLTNKYDVPCLTGASSFPFPLWTPPLRAPPTQAAVGWSFRRHEQVWGRRPSAELRRAHHCARPEVPSLSFDFE